MPEEQGSQALKAIVHIFYALFIVVPYYYLEALVTLFRPKKKPKSVKGEVVLITGTGHGIGKLLAIKYAQEGATVVAWDINEEVNVQTVQHIQKLGYKNIYGYRVDVSNRQNVMETAQKVRNSVGDVTILINNAGIMPHHLFLEHTEAEVRRIMDINVMANFWTLQAFLPAMQKNNYGHVVTLSSMAGLLGLKNLVPYNASKFAVRGLMDGLYEEFRRSPNNNVHFTTVYPYMVDTGLCKSVEITYPVFFKMLKPEYVVEKVFEAQVNNRRYISIPKSFEYLITLSTLFYPEKAINYFTDNIKTDLLSDIAFESKNQSNGDQKKAE
ncbi:short-chain dehydrogenase/reductase family 16C member 6-like isoform X2 [Euwallacea similis]|uniref:short-chain dehydrogenase/reductase family 16C member 6-like isoform X2 n=1 Tax=Euwallacea similis TaxID=1736056 RepID=UPI00344FF4CE